MNSTELGTRVKEMKEEAEYLKREIIQSEDDVNDVQEEFNEIQSVVINLVDKFKKAKFSTRVSQRMQYDDSVQFNENNITLYLGELEEYFATLIAY